MNEEINEVCVDNTEEQVIETLENVSNEKLLDIILCNLDYKPIKDVLVKPMQAVKVLKEVNKPVASEELDEDGKPIMEMRKEDIEVESIFREGIVLALPIDSKYPDCIKVGDRIVYNHKFSSVEFDLFKDSVLVKPFDILFIKK